MSATPAPRTFWDLVDGVLVINLDQRPERWQRLREETAGLIPEGKLHRVSAVPGKLLPGFGHRPWFRGGRRDATWAGRAGCALAHRRALETARTHGWERVLILEDDISFGSGFAELEAGLAAALAAHSWDICYLGYTDPSGPFARFADLSAGHALWRAYGCNCAHAYLVTAAVRDWILAHLPAEDTVWSWISRHRAVDRWYLRTLGRHFRVFAVSPSVVNQAAGFSDIVGRTTDYQGAGVHQISIPATSSAACFGIRLVARRMGSVLGEAYDFLRGLLKRWRGF